MNVLQREVSDSFKSLDDAAPYILDGFLRFDINGDGVISKDEFAQILSKLDPEVWTLDKIDALVDAMDWNHDHEIQYQEFVRWCCSEEGDLQADFHKSLHMLSGTCYEGLSLHFDAGTLPDPQMDQEHGSRLQGQLPAPADGFAAWEVSGHRPIFAWELGVDDLAWGLRCNTRAQPLEPPFTLPSTSFTIGMWLRRWPGSTPLALFQCCHEVSVVLNSDGLLVFPRSAGTRAANFQLPSHKWVMLLFSVHESKCNVFVAWDAHGFCGLGEISDSLGGKTLCSIGAAEPVSLEDSPGICQIAKFVVWDRALSETERLNLFTSSAPRFGHITLGEARHMNSGRPVPRTFWQNQEYARLLKCASAGGEPPGVANFSGLRVNDADIPEIIEAIVKGKVKQLRLVDILISSEGVQTLLAAFQTELKASASLLLSGCKAVAEVSSDVLDRFSDIQVVRLETECCGFESSDVCRFRKLIKTRPRPATRPSKPARRPADQDSEKRAVGKAAEPEAEEPEAEEPEATEPEAEEPEAEEPEAAEPEAALVHEPRCCSAGTRWYADPSTGFKRVEALARDTPEEHATTPSKLAAYCNEVAATDATKAWFLFAWCAYHIDYDTDAYDGRSERRPGDACSVLAQFAKYKKRLGMCDAYSHTFHELAQEIGLNAHFVCGHARNLSRSVNQDIVHDGVGAHGWNAVEIEGKMYLLDCTWGAGGCGDKGFEREVQPYWFGVPPEELAFTHYPEDPQWQLLPAPISYETFIKQPIVELSLFFGGGFEFHQRYRPSGTIVLKASNQGSLRLKIPKGLADVPAKIGPGIGTDNLNPQGCFCICRGDEATVHFRVPRGDQIHTLALYATSAKDPMLLGLLAKLHVRGPANPETFIEPYFPRVNMDAFRTNRMRFEDEVPHGVVLASATNQARVVIYTSPTTKLLPDCASKNSSLLLQHEDERVTILVNCPVGQHQLHLFAKQRKDVSPSFPFAVGWKISVLPGCKISDRLPKTFSRWSDFRGYLEMPLSGQLKSGKQHFRLRFNKELLGSHKLCVYSGFFETELKPKGNDGIFECDAQVATPTAAITCKGGLFLETILEFNVV